MGKKNVFQYCGLFTVVGGVALFFVPTGGIILALVFLAIKGVGASLINTVMFGLEADTVEYGEWKTGKRSEGATYALFSFTRKITQSIGGAGGAWALAIGGYITKLAVDQVQPDSAITAIKASIGLVPAAAAILAMLAFIAYPLTEKRYAEIIEESDTRKQKFLEEQNIARKLDSGRDLTQQTPPQPDYEPQTKTVVAPSHRDRPRTISQWQEVASCYTTR